MYVCLETKEYALYFMHLPRRPPRPDLQEMFHSGSCPKRTPVAIFWQLVLIIIIYGGRILAFSMD